MDEVVKKSIDELNEILPKKKRLINEDSTHLISSKSNLESIDLVNLFINIEQNIKKEKNLSLTFDDITNNIDKLKTIGSLKSYLKDKFKNEKK